MLDDTELLADIDVPSEEGIGELDGAQDVADPENPEQAERAALETVLPLDDLLLLDDSPLAIAPGAISRWYTAPSLLRLRTEYDGRVPGRSKLSDGIIGNLAHQKTRSDHNPDWTAGGVVRAIDLTTTSLRDRAEHQALVQDLIRTEWANPVDRIWYVIHYIPGDGYSKIWSRTNNWSPRRYVGANPHDKHFHVSLMRTRAAERSSFRWFSEFRKPKPQPQEDKDMALDKDDIEAIAAKVLTLDGVINNNFTGNKLNTKVTLRTAIETLGENQRDIKEQLDDLEKLIKQLVAPPPPT